MQFCFWGIVPIFCYQRKIMAYQRQNLAQVTHIMLTDSNSR